MKSKTRILAPTSPTILRSRSLRETSLMRSRLRLGGGWPGSRRWWSPPTCEDVFDPGWRRRWSPPSCGDVFDKVCDVGLEEVGPVEANRGLHPAVENQWREKWEKGEKTNMRAGNGWAMEEVGKQRWEREMGELRKSAMEDAWEVAYGGRVRQPAMEGKRAN